ncbi:MAG: hypothetical protein GY783_14445, partial [Gammaproteobacteria bacterium]|nr:hypothetical protein [Gammaproteobacteria bacterium]
MAKRIDPGVRVVYARLWRYVTPHKLIGFIALVGMALTALVEASLVALVAPLTAGALVAKQLDAVRWVLYAFVGV